MGTFPPGGLDPSKISPRTNETRTHTGDGSDDESCVLLDHIPHNDCCSPSLYDPATYTPYAITINIPNVHCERCSLHLSNPMTDKIGDDGSPYGIGCTDPDGTCFSVYHSCTRPFRIVGNDDNGAVPRSEYACPSLGSVNDGWPTSWIGDDGEAADASVPGVYRRISSEWSADDYTLMTAPEAYREDTGASLKWFFVSKFCSENYRRGRRTPPSPKRVTLSCTHLILNVIDLPHSYPLISFVRRFMQIRFPDGPFE
jgi:hypothetical protein